MCQTVKEIETLEAKHGDVLSQILKEKKDRIKLEKMNSSPFKSQEKLHQEAFKKSRITSNESPCQSEREGRGRNVAWSYFCDEINCRTESDTGSG